MHLVSDVVGTLKEGFGPLEALRACFPAGTLTGAPKVRAMEIIEEFEPHRRGIYGGCVGYVGFGGTLDMGITIRTVWVRHNTAYFQAGGGIVADSDPASEEEEVKSKAMAMAQAIEMANTMKD
jgi:anthranilate synthase component 1